MPGGLASGSRNLSRVAGLIGDFPKALTIFATVLHDGVAEMNRQDYIWCSHIDGTAACFPRSL
ncbi:hypothetical protein Poly59_15510 [Rubripirellula reticaptiva]|uniref:Uncharacterized protein n=1 Tax=Rubripirellula reticaptiva TaxID=2528013 RepID=A0A5C6F3Z6_9BACT|nr:hypothetical protein Poly59_15510 [Rubripirellula reticaptiva]